MTQGLQAEDSFNDSQSGANPTSKGLGLAPQEKRYWNLQIKGAKASSFGWPSTASLK